MASAQLLRLVMLRRKMAQNPHV